MVSATGRVRLIEAVETGYVELEGTPDMVLEVISPGSVRKDRTILRESYWEAEVSEYWLVDPRHEPLQFDLLRHGPRGYVATRKQAGWLKSAALGHSFQLTQETGPDGFPAYTLVVR
jgi:Uma2 family endonuclease